MIDTGSVFRFHGKRLRLNLAYDIVLSVYDLLNEQELGDAEKLDIALYLLVKNHRVTKRMPFDRRNELLTTIFEDYLRVKGKPSKGPKVVDFKQDAAYIWASFMLDYGIDLNKQRLDWRQFIALFQGLSEKTKIREVMAIRARKIPPADKHNAEEIRELREAKAYYALDVSDTEAAENLNEGIGRIADMLQAQKGR